MPQERPPYVEFYFRPVEDRAQSIATGHYVAKDVAFVKVWRPGSGDMLDKNAADWLLGLENSARQGMIPETWPTHFTAKYEAWKKGEELPLNGTPIKGWPVLSPSAQQAVIKSGYLTVEDLAHAPDQEVSSIGIGAITFKQKAKTWLEQAEGPGKVVERVTALEVKIQQLIDANKALSEENIKLKVKSTAKA